MCGFALVNEVNLSCPQVILPSPGEEKTSLTKANKNAFRRRPEGDLE